MELKKYQSSLSPDERERFASACETTVGHMRNVMYGYRPCSPEMASAIERASVGQVRRWDLRPDDWHLIWPELIGIPGAPAIPAGEVTNA